MKAKGWTQGDLAKCLGTKSSVVNRWLHGDQKPGRRFAKAIELHCGVEQGDWDKALRKPFRLQQTAPIPARGAGSADDSGSRAIPSDEDLTRATGS
jgi:transcriptional regulator with XRE-family HTH domain